MWKRLQQFFFLPKILVLSVHTFSPGFIAMASTPDTPQALINLVQSLSHVITYTDSSNVDTNRKLWDNYAREWVRALPMPSTPLIVAVYQLLSLTIIRFFGDFPFPQSTDADYVVKMVNNLSDSKDATPGNYLHLLGEEWSDRLSFQQVLEDFFWPNLKESDQVAELGSGGGRVSSRVVRHVGSLHCYDISKEMLKKAEKAVADSLQEASLSKPTKFEFLAGPALPADVSSTYDFVYAFDVFPHVDLHTQWKYYQEFARVLKPGGKAIIHTANLEAPEGWDRFASQGKYSVGGFYFMAPSSVLMLARKAGLEVVLTSAQVQESEKKESRSANTYYNRDFMVLVSKPAASQTPQ